ncbi:hypothetical protein BaRGS_00004543, partial [Batillaria attramentaria]
MYDLLRKLNNQHYKQALTKLERSSGRQEMHVPVSDYATQLTVITELYATKSTLFSGSVDSLGIQLPYQIPSARISLSG